MKRIFFTKKEVTYTENKIRKGNKNILAIVYDIIIITTFQNLHEKNFSYNKER